MGEKKKEKELEAKEKEQKEREDAIAFNDNAENDENKDDLNKISKSMDVDILDSSDVVFDASLNKRIRMSSNYEMYPFDEYEEDETIMTEYGLKVDLNEWRAEPTKSPKKKNMNDEADEFEILARSLSPSPNDIVNQTMSLLPTNVLHPDPLEPMKTIKEQIFVKCQLKWLNIEGRSDEESIKQTLPTLQPRKIILVHGSMQQKEDFKRFIVSEKICNDVHIAHNEQWTKLKSNTKYKKIIMDDVIERSLPFCTINGYDVSYLNGKLLQINKDEMDIDIGDMMFSMNMGFNDIQYKLTTKTNDDENKKKKENEAEDDVKGDDDDNDDNDDDADEGMDDAADDINKMMIKYAGNDGHSLTFLGDVTKIEMETNLKQNNIAAELYHGGTLVAGRSGEVRITHKNAQKTTLSIDATLTADYFGIRDTVSSQYHLI